MSKGSIGRDGAYFIHMKAAENDKDCLAVDNLRNDGTLDPWIKEE